MSTLPENKQTAETKMQNERIFGMTYYIFHHIFLQTANNPVI
jgi:hypothetical protein